MFVCLSVCLLVSSAASPDCRPIEHVIAQVSHSVCMFVGLLSHLRYILVVAVVAVVVAVVVMAVVAAVVAVAVVCAIYFSSCLALYLY